MVLSIRVRLTIWYTALVALVFVFVGWATYEYVSRTLQSTLDRSLINETKWLAARLERGLARGESHAVLREDFFEHAAYYPIKEYVEVWDTAGSAVYRSPNLADDTLLHHATGLVDSTWNVFTIRTFRDHDIRVVTQRVATAKIVLAMPMDLVTTPINEFLRTFTWLGPIVIVLSLGGGYVLAKKSLSKVEDVTNTARRISIDRLNDRIPPHQADDEIGRLVSTFNDMIARLDASINQMRQFSADASHELRTPLAVIRTQLEEALNSNLPASDLRRVTAQCLDEAIRMTKIVNDLLLLARGEVGATSIDRSPVSLTNLLNDTFQESVVLAGTKNISVELTRTDSAVVQGDAQRLRQMLLNLIDNAIKYGHPGGRILLQLTRSDGSAVITVADDGPGIPPEHIPKIFDRFYRVDKARSREIGGSGLGLSIVKWIVGVHGGTIQVSSQVNHGTEFRVRLPLIP
jgi:two-component system OmpR family sensor kinase